MNFLIKNARIVHPNQAEPTPPMDIFIENGIIQKIGNSLNIKELNQFDAAGNCISVSFFDIGATVGEPGFEHRETLETAARAAIAGGFSHVACLPNNDPVMDSKTSVYYLKNRNSSLPLDFLPIGALSVGAKGTDMAELFDMHTAGAVAFSDGAKSVQDAGFLLRALQYVQAFGGKIMNHPHHKTIASGGQMHEGLRSTQLGLRGISALSEEMIILRDLQLVEYTAGKLHFSQISTRKSVEMIRLAKNNGHQITASVAAWNLGFTDIELEEFESNWKLSPPIRLETDADGLRAGIADGTIDFIESAHTPWDEESKNLEFTYAQFGAIGLETAFAVAQTFLHKQLTINQLVEKMTVSPRRFLELEIPKIEVGAVANLTIFDPEKCWVFSEKDIRSKSKNTPLVGRTLIGKVLGVFTKGKWHQND
jgi:dihydroorotase